MLKAADALAGAGYDVRMVSTCFLDWATGADREARQGRSWRWTTVDYRREAAWQTWLQSGLRSRAAGLATRLLGPRLAPAGLAAQAFSRVHPELLRAALAEPADLFYGGTIGALAATATAARRAGVPYALDLEDFHGGERAETPEGKHANALAGRVERAVLPGAAFLTAGSVAIATAYREVYGLSPVPVHNVFPLPAAPALEPSPGPGLRLYWFSQTIGPGRGLEIVIEAMGRAGIPGEIHLRGRPAGGFLEVLRSAAAAVSGLRLAIHEPAPPGRMVELCAGYDVGLAVEPGSSVNNALSLSNKALTYPLAGLPVVLTDIPGHGELARDFGEGALLVRPGDATGLAAGLRRWSEDRALLARARAAAWEAARRRWHWEHPLERGALLAAVERAIAA